MAKANRGVFLVQKPSILGVAAESYLPVPLAHWRKIMERIDEIDDHSATWTNVAWACVSAGVSFGLVAVTLPFSVEFTRYVPTDHGAVSEVLNWPALLTEVGCLLFALCAAVGAVCSFCAARTERQSSAKIRRMILEDMQFLEGRCIQESPGGSLPEGAKSSLPVG